MELKNYEFNAHGVELGQFYELRARSCPTARRARTPTRDPELYYQASTVPGSRLPHAWVGDADAQKVSTLDLAPYAQFTVFTGIAGEAWVDAAAEVAAELGVPLEAVVIGPGREYTDLYYDWARLREIDEDGALLVRPDKHIAWRSAQLPADPADALPRRPDRDPGSGGEPMSLRFAHESLAQRVVFDSDAAADRVAAEVERLDARRRDGDRRGGGPR